MLQGYMHQMREDTLKHAGAGFSGNRANNMAALIDAVDAALWQ